VSLDRNYSGFGLEAGCDEAGRGCLAGPVFAAAVILPNTLDIDGLNDSKKLNVKQRESLRTVIEKEALAWAVASVDHDEIDAMNILQASITAMHKALNKLIIQPQYIVVDGIHFKPYTNIPYACLPKGDAKLQSIAAASILAKTYRDDFMRELHKEFPSYCWDKNLGYPTPEHKKAIVQHGFSPYHRKSFSPNLQLRLNW